MPSALSLRQREVLTIIRDCAPDSWGEVWAHYTGRTTRRTTSLAHDFRNFDRVTDAVVRKGLVHESSKLLTLTDAGRAALETP